MPIDSSKPATPIGWFVALRERYPQWYCSSPRSEVDLKPWPARFDPRRDPVFAHNDVLIDGVEPERVFDLLVRAENWPKYYDDSKQVRIESWPAETAARTIGDRGGAGPIGLLGAVLKAAASTASNAEHERTRSSQFRGKDSGGRGQSSSGCGPFPPVLRLGTKFHWETFSTLQRSEVTLYEPDRALGWTAESFGTHAYHRWLLIPEDGSTRVITEECQRGFVAWLDQRWMNPSLHATHQLWLEELKRAARQQLVESQK